MAKRDYYEVLGVEKSASAKEIKSSFRKLAKKYHPDVCKEADCEANFKEAQEAYAVLSDENNRQKYDQFGHAAFEQGQGGFGGGGFDFSGFDFSDILSDLFGGGGFGGFGGFGSSRRNPNAPRKGRDSEMMMNITFEESINGTKKDIDLTVEETCETCHGDGGTGVKTCSNCHGSGRISVQQRTMFGTMVNQQVCPECNGKGKTVENKCPDCHGAGRVKKPKTITVTIPAGIDSGQQLRVSGKGEAGYNGGPSGDLYLVFRVKEDELFEREGQHLHLELPITFPQASLGDKIDVPTPYGTVELKIPHGTQSETVFRLKGKGVPYINSSRVGDLYVHVKVIVPTSLNKKQRDLIQKLGDTNLTNESVFQKIVNAFK
jgi:molecular chaperone DnaJ